MKKTLMPFILISLMLWLCACTPGKQAQSEPSPVPTRPELKIEAQSSLSIGKPVYITFSLPMVEYKGEEIQGFDPERVNITITPEMPGTYSWISQQMLVFRPGIETLEWGQEFKITIDKAIPLSGEEFALPYEWEQTIHAEYLQILGKVASWPFREDYPRFIQALTSKTDSVGQGPILLLYDQVFDSAKLAKHLKITDESGKPLAFKVSAPTDVSYILDDLPVAPEIQGVYISKLPEEGSQVILEIPDWISADLGGSGGISFQSVRLTVRKSFTVTNIEVPESRENIYRLESSIFLYFNNLFFTSQLGNDLIDVEPSPVSQMFYQNYDGAIVVQVKLEPGTDYKLTVSGECRDVLGNPLEMPPHEFRSQDLVPVLETPAYPIVIEKNVNTVPIKIRNMSKMEAWVYNFEDGISFAKALLSPDLKTADQYYGLSGNPKTFKTDTGKTGMNVFFELDARIDGTPGLKCIEIRGEGTGTEAYGVLTDTILLQCTNTGITSKVLDNQLLVLATSLDTATLLPKTAVELFTDSGEKIGSGVTDAMGAALIKNVPNVFGYGVSEPIVVIANYKNQLSVSRLVNEELSSAWQFGLAGELNKSNPLRAAVFTDRGIYRPGETVRFKIILSRNSSYKGNEIAFGIRDPRGQSLISDDAAKTVLDDFSAASRDFVLPQDAPVGEYSVQVTLGNHITTRTFIVEEYRIPTFIVSLKTDLGEWKIGETRNVTIDADYLKGGKLGGRQVRWSAFRQYEAFESPSFPKFRFTNDVPSELNNYIADEESQLNDMGKLTVSVGISRSEAAAPARYILEASVTDVDRQVYSAKTSKLVHSSDFYIGVAPPSRTVTSSEETIRFPVIAVTPDGKPVENIKVTGSLERIDHHTTGQLTESGKVELFNRQYPQLVSSLQLTTAKTPVEGSFYLPRAGYYRIRLEASDSANRPARVSFIITATGESSIAWPRFDKDQIELVMDKEIYRPGDTATIAIQTPFDTATGFLTVEQDTIITYKSFRIRNNTPSVSLPIISRYSPNIFVSVVLLRGRIHNKKDASGFETGAPGFKIGYKKVSVETRDQRLAVSAIPRQRTLMPGSKIAVDIMLTDSNSKPVSGQVTLIAVDEAVLSLTGHKTPDPIPELYIDYLLGIRTGSLYLDLPNSRRSRKEQLFPGGGFGGDYTLPSDTGNILRKSFKTTAYWNPNIRTGKDGKASVSFTLPDNTTTFRIMAIASDKSSRAGFSEDKIICQKPLMIQPALPRFTYADDEFTAEVLVYNATSAQGTVSLQASFDGLAMLSGGEKQSIVTRAGAASSFKYRVKALRKKQAVLKFSAIMGKHKDAIQVAIPQFLPDTRRVMVESRIVAREDAIRFDLLGERIPGTLSFDATVSGTALSELKDAVEYIMEYPHGCIEQTTSGTYPLLILGDLLSEIGVEVDRSKLKEYTEAGIKRLLSFRTPSGGLSFWPGGNDPHVFGTAFGLTALLEARKKKFEVGEDVITELGNFLLSALRDGEIGREMKSPQKADADTMAFITMTLGRMGKTQDSYVSTLFKEKDRLSPFGLAFLAVAAKEAGAQRTMIDDILADIRKASRETSNEAYFEGQASGSWSFSTPQRSHACALLAYAEADGSDEMTRKLLYGLLKRRTNGLWGTTQGNVFGMMAVHAAVKNKEQNANEVTLTVNGKRYLPKDMIKLSARTYRLVLKDSDFTTNRIECRVTNNGIGSLFFNARASYSLLLKGKTLEARNQGISIQRRLETLDGKHIQGNKIAPGSMVRVRLITHTGRDLHYVAIDDKLPAGLEALNLKLATTETFRDEKITRAMVRGSEILSYSEVRDQRVAFYADEMKSGEYEFTYLARATTPGVYLRPNARAEAMYQPEVYGITATEFVTVE